MTPDYPDFATPEECHNLYLSVTGTQERACPLTLERRRWWEVLLFHRHTLDDVQLVFRFILAERKRRSWSYSVLNLSRVIASLTEFQEWLQQAQAAARTKREYGQKAKAQVLKEFRGSAEPDKALVKTPLECLPEQVRKGLEDLRKAAE